MLVIGVWRRGRGACGGLFVRPRLATDQAARLDALDELWRLEPDWNGSCRRLLAYLAGGGTIDGPANRTGFGHDPAFRPGTWLRKQDKARSGGKLTGRQTALLDGRHPHGRGRHRPTRPPVRYRLPPGSRYLGPSYTRSRRWRQRHALQLEEHTRARQRHVHDLQQSGDAPTGAQHAGHLDQMLQQRGATLIAHRQPVDLLGEGPAGTARAVTEQPPYRQAISSGRPPTARSASVRV
ncbi:hypothetical protein AB0O91_38190 [Kitasatospora sp. NPDC089797]|uniref:hypothetical protein n=1 Tax=Kitasatospora sp. NPDC089797 TaxID=3155298 RepID=UPI003433B095